MAAIWRVQCGWPRVTASPAGHQGKRGLACGVHQGQDEDENSWGWPQGAMSPSPGPQLGRYCLWEAAEVVAGTQPQV